MLNNIQVLFRSKRVIDTFNIQKNNTGHDNPPGVKDWYEFGKEYGDEDVVFECQKQNASWNNELSRQREHLSKIVYALIIVFSISYIYFNKIKLSNLLRIAAGIEAILFTFGEQYYHNKKYTEISLKIDGAINTMKNSRLDSQIYELQKQIEYRRTLPVVEINYLHKTQSKRISEEYLEREKYK